MSDGPKSMREAVHRVRMWTLSCCECSDYLEAFPPDSPNDLVKTAKDCGWVFRKGYVFCNKCKPTEIVLEGK